MGNTTAANRARDERRTGLILTKDKIATILGRSVSWVEKEIKAGAPVTYKGRPGVPAKIDSAEFVQWMLTKEREKVEEKFGGSGESRSEEDAKIRLSHARAEREEIMVMRLKNQVVDTEVLERVLSRTIMDSRALLLSLPSKLAPIVALKSDPNEVQAEIETAIHEALSELSSSDINSRISEEMLQAVGSATETDSESVGGQEP